MIYTEEQWKIIKQASPHYESARHEYIRNAPRLLTQQVIDVYEAATGKTVMHKDLSCAVCVLNIYKQIGKTYFDDLKNHQNKNFDDLENHQNKNFKDKLEREKIELDNDKYEQGNAKSESRDTKKKSRNTGEGKKGKKQEQNS